jgi:hypothetical protein
MTTKRHLAQKLLTIHDQVVQNGKPHRCFVGFDGFTDEIIRVVDQRLNSQKFEPLYTITDFGKRIMASAGKSCNLELVPIETRLGGNAPIMAQALLSVGHEITFAGAIGADGHVEPIFQAFAHNCKRVIPLCPSGHTDALEFYDGKVLLGKIGVLAEVCYDALIQQLPEEDLVNILDNCDLFASANWTMLPNMNDMWKQIIERILPRFTQNKTRYLFIDLADTAKRSGQDLKEALELLRLFQPAFKVIQGLNHSEAQQVYQALIGPPPGPGQEQVEVMAKHIRKHLGIHQVVVHATRFAVAASEEDSARVEGPYCPEPKISTGGGDHFNAGYCSALLYNASLQECLLSGIASSGYYIRTAKTPNIQDICNFLEKWQTSESSLNESNAF